VDNRDSPGHVKTKEEAHVSGMELKSCGYQILFVENTVHELTRKNFRHAQTSRYPFGLSAGETVDRITCGV
jgi:hypothetical protein